MQENKIRSLEDLDARIQETTQRIAERIEKLSALSIPELVERYQLRLEQVGNYATLVAGDTARLYEDGMVRQITALTPAIVDYLRESGAPAKFVPAFVQDNSNPVLRQNVVKKHYTAQFYNANGCLQEQTFIGESLDAARIQAVSYAKQNNLAFHDIREPAEILQFPGKAGKN